MQTLGDIIQSITDFKYNPHAKHKENMNICRRKWEGNKNVSLQKKLTGKKAEMNKMRDQKIAIKHIENKKQMAKISPSLTSNYISVNKFSNQNM